MATACCRNLFEVVFPTLAECCVSGLMVGCDNKGCVRMLKNIRKGNSHCLIGALDFLNNSECVV